MKKYYRVLSIVLIFLFILTGCKKDEGTTAPESTSQSSFSCKVDGNDFVANAPNSAVVAGYTNNNLTIAATYIQGTSGGQITLMLINVSGTGTLNPGYAVGGSYASYTRTSGTTAETFMTDAANTGTIELTKLDQSTKSISGTFSFKAKSVSGNTIVNITSGTFNTSYQ